MALNDDDVREILRIIDESELDELSIETEGFSLHVRKGSGPADARSESGRESPLAERASPPAAQPSRSQNNGLETIASPMLGTFYRAEAPGAAPFVEIGAQVSPDTTVCIIEVMKMMNSVPAGVAGTVAEVIAENAKLVEYGEPLFGIEPESA
ncbi:MAG: acetyl-CoA carboxylase biotin carboxyl carrier protein [Solirubrobacteraceae bacterium]